MKHLLTKIIMVGVLIMPLLANADIPATKIQFNSGIGLDKSNAQINSTCSASALCKNGSTVECSTTESGAICQGVDQYCKASGGSSGGYAKCGSKRSYCGYSGCPLCPEEGKSCSRDIHCGWGTCANNVCECY